MAERHRVGSAEDLAPGERLIVDAAEREIAVFNLDGEYHALLNYCVHQGGPLCEGSVRGILTEDLEEGLKYEKAGEVVTCPWHGWEFDIPTGEHVARKQFRIPTYDVVVEDGDLYVEI